MSAPPVGSPRRPLRVAVVGSGPSGFYAIEALFKAEKLFGRPLSVEVGLFDRLPTPFGLVRGGVAPDHQKIKSVARIYEALAADPRLRFYGNVRLGRDLGLDDLLASHDQVVLAVGNESDRRLGIPGEDLDGVHSATSFVGWYNAHPDHLDHRFGLAEGRTAVVVGNGNVAMDVTRILVSQVERLVATDIAEYAVAALRESRVRTVHLVGRRGPAQAAFSPKEIQEVGEVPGCDLRVQQAAMQLDAVTRAWVEAGGPPRSALRNLKYLEERAAVPADPDASRIVQTHFLLSPVEFLGEGGRLRAVRFERNELHAAADGTPRPRGTGEIVELEADLCFKAIGYRGVPIGGVPFDDRAGTIPNLHGRVLREPGGDVLPRVFVVGWAKRGPSGLIGTNSPDSKATAERMVEDLETLDPAPPATDIDTLLRDRGVDFVSFADWQILDAHERAEGERLGKVRHKVATVAEMLEVIRAGRAARTG